ncbi:hypothetical protein FQA39_LY07064 [Lamprigera yunnana]|nr:hypothetical protein FQA39_LY07064 [Lamprigera yunnana]
MSFTDDTNNIASILKFLPQSAENSRGPKRTKVSPYAGIIPFLRTGRSHSHSPFTDYEIDNPMKRAKSGRTIMAFPRVGRSEAMEWMKNAEFNDIEKKNDIGNNNGLWFGPRLGRMQKRHYKDVPSSAYLLFGDYTPRLGRESEAVDSIDETSEDEEAKLNRSI